MRTINKNLNYGFNRLQDDTDFNTSTFIIECSIYNNPQLS